MAREKSFKDAVAMQNWEQVFPTFSIFSPLKSKMVAKELTSGPWVKYIQVIELNDKL